MLYSCTHMATVGFKGLNHRDVIVYQSMHTDQAHVSINTRNLFSSILNMLFTYASLSEIGTKFCDSLPK